jgi:hypothetical protein
MKTECTRRQREACGHKTEMNTGGSEREIEDI